MSMLDEATVEQFKVEVCGELIQPGEPDYAEARKAYNEMIEEHPRMIVRCSDVADVISCVNFARENDVILAVRGGGHSVAGFGLVDDGLVIDLSPMRGVRVDAQARTVRVEGGATLGDVDHATHAFGLAVPAGVVSTTGIGGLTHMEQAEEAMRWYRDFIPRAPEELNGLFAFLVVPPGPPFPEHLHGKTMCGVVWCYAGPLEEAEEAFRPIRRFGPPALDLAGPMPLPTLNSMFDPMVPPGLQQYWTGDFIDELSDEAIALHVKYGEKTPTYAPDLRG